MGIALNETTGCNVRAIFGITGLVIIVGVFME
jgi:hypothetical protein